MHNFARWKDFHESKTDRRGNNKMKLNALDMLDCISFRKTQCEQNEEMHNIALMLIPFCEFRTKHFEFVENRNYFTLFILLCIVCVLSFSLSAHNYFLVFLRFFSSLSQNWASVGVYWVRKKTKNNSSCSRKL